MYPTACAPRVIPGAGPCWRRPAWLALVAAFGAAGCDLGNADRVLRTPDAASRVVPPTASDAADDETPTADDAPLETRPETGGGDARRGTTPDGDTRLAADRADASDGRGDTSILDPDAGYAGETGSACGSSAVVFCDDFEDGAAGWMSTGIAWAVGTEDADATANDVLAPTGPAASSAFYAAGAWQDMTATVRVKVTSFGHASSSDRVELYARYQNANHFYAVSLRGDGRIGLRANASSIGPTVEVSVMVGVWHTLALRVAGPASNVALEGFLDGTLLLTATDTAGSLTEATGTVGVGIYGETYALFDDVAVSSP
jgi:hypothetical protein